MAKKALIVGINSYPTAPLQGCVNDAELMHDILTQKYDFPEDDVRVLCDGRATTDAIKHRLNWLVSGAKEGDTLVFHFSGHGSQVRDRGPLDELADHKDEILCPVDLDWRDKVITDDDLGQYLKRVPNTANFYVVLDCCHSGTGTRGGLRPPGEDGGNPHRINYRYIHPPFDIEARFRNRDMPTARFGLGIERNTMKRERKRAAVAPPSFPWWAFWRWLQSKPAPPPPPPPPPDHAKVIEDMNHVLVSGCRSDQTSADAYLGDRYQGAMTYNLTEVINTKPDAPLRAVHEEARTNILSRFTQESQLEGPSRLLDRPIFT
jgi:hypothetical protein